MADEFLVSLLKAGGLAGLSIGMVYLLYREIIKLGVVPKLKQSQGFALLCMLALMVFVIAMTVLLRQPRPEDEKARGAEAETSPQGELPADSHFQLDTREGIFCQATNVRQPSAVYFDMVDINVGRCNDSSESGSRTYRVNWRPRGPQAVVPASRLGFQHCFISDFAELAAGFVGKVDAAFESNRTSVPCKVSVSMNRLVEIHYLNLRNESQHVAFLQSYNRNGAKNLEIQQIPASNLARSDTMAPVSEQPGGGLSDQDVLNIASEYRYAGIPIIP